jgi:hypothetical protein
VLVSTLRKIHSLATRPFGTVQAFIAAHACVTTVVCAWVARYLDIYTFFTSLPASCTTGVAIQHNSRRLREASCEKQAEGYRAYFHYDAINFGLASASCHQGLSQYSRELDGLSGEIHSEFATYSFIAGLISRSCQSRFSSAFA